MNFEYIILSENADESTGYNYNMDSNLFFKINRFYQNKCMEQDSNMWKCKILHNRLYIKKVFGNRILEVSERPKFYCENVLPITTTFQKKNISFVKKCFLQNIIEKVPEYLPIIPDEVSEVNEICFEIENLNSREIYHITLRQITNLKTKTQYYYVSYLTQSREMFYMLLPFYLWETESSSQSHPQAKKKFNYSQKKENVQEKKVTHRAHAANASRKKNMHD